ncbi:MAG: glycosyltransferase [Gemmatimonadaceae bacterium]|nr:glycosyltransferase [Gemmatimonadaceae bacterium]
MTAPEAGSRWLKGGPAIHNPLARRILLVSAAFPPRTEVGSARWEGFAPHLHEQGYALDVALEDPSDLPSPDFGRLAALPDSVRAFAFPQHTVRWHRALLNGRALLAPDPSPTSIAFTSVNRTEVASGRWRTMRQWIGYLLEAAVAHERSHRNSEKAERAITGLLAELPDVIVSSGPPHYAHWAAFQIAQRTGVPHVVDLRDPWGDGGAMKPLLIFDPDLRRRAPTVLRAASAVIVNTNESAHALLREHSLDRSRVVTIPNGSDLSAVTPPLKDGPQPFRITHCGSLYLDRDPRPFLEAVSRVQKSQKLAPDELRVTFMGPPVRVEGKSLDEWGEFYGLRAFLDILPFGSRKDARALLAQSAMAVAFQGASPTQIPAKIFEYVSYPLFLLALVGTNSATAAILQNSTAIVLNIDDVDGIERAITSALHQFRERGLPTAVGADGRFSRAHQARALLDLFDRVIK